MKNNYIVRDEKLLGYIVGTPNEIGARMVVMAVDVENGGDSTLIDREMLALKGHYRYATKDDEERFMIRLF